jgi:hypothetical protein
MNPVDLLADRMAELEAREAKFLERQAQDAERRRREKFYADQRSAIAKRESGWSTLPSNRIGRIITQRTYHAYWVLERRARNRNLIEH